MAIDILFSKVCRKKVPSGEYLKCIEYFVVYKESGEKLSPSYISIDMTWGKFNINASQDTWYRLIFEKDSDSYMLEETDIELSNKVVEMMRTLVIELMLTNDL